MSSGYLITSTSRTLQHHWRPGPPSRQRAVRFMRTKVVTFRTKADSLALPYRSSRSPTRVSIGPAVKGSSTAAPRPADAKN